MLDRNGSRTAARGVPALVRAAVLVAACALMFALGCGSSGDKRADTGFPDGFLDDPFAIGEGWRGGDPGPGEERRPARVIAPEAGVASANAGGDEVVATTPAELAAVVADPNLFQTERGSTVRTAPTRTSLARPQEISKLVHELASLLRAEADEAPSPAAVLAQLAALEMIEPGVFNSHVADLDGRSAVSVLTRREIEALAPLRGFFARSHEQLMTTGAVMDLAEEAERLADELAEFRPLTIPRAALATRVAGYGIVQELKTYDEEGTYKLLATRPHAAIVYAEVGQFVSRARRQDNRDGFGVELRLELALYHDDRQNNLLVWKTEPQQVIDFSENRRRDFYITQKITLPRTLTVGSYRLKVRVSDINNEGAVAEAVLPLDLVGDASALTAAGR